MCSYAPYSVAILLTFKNEGESVQNRTLYLSQSAIVDGTITFKRIALL